MKEKEVELYAGCTIDKAFQMVADEARKCGCACFAKFNGKEIRSTDTLDDVYMKVVGKTKAEHDAFVKEWLDEQKRKRDEHKARIPQLAEEYKEKARGLVRESELEEWNRVVPIRLGDIYRGIELDQTLDCCRVMRDETLTREQRLRKAYKLFQDAGHSVNSAGLTMAMLRHFCPDGNELANACNEFRYDENHVTKIFVARNRDGKLYLHAAYPSWWPQEGSFYSPNAVELNPLQFPEIKPGVRVEYNAGEVFDTNR